MTLAILSCVHANLSALTAGPEDIEAPAITRIAALGDDAASYVTFDGDVVRFHRVAYA